jgi:hypothetical protein
MKQPLPHAEVAAPGVFLISCEFTLGIRLEVESQPVLHRSMLQVSRW